MRNIQGLSLLILSFCLCLSASLSAQQRTQTPLQLELDGFNDEAHILQNEDADGFTLFLQDKQVIWALKVNDSLEVEVPFRGANPLTTRGNLKFLGGIHHGDSSSLLYGNKRLTSILWITVNYLNGFSKQEEADLKYEKKEDVLCSYTFDDNFYIITSNLVSSALTVYDLSLRRNTSEVDKDGKLEQLGVVQIQKNAFGINYEDAIKISSLRVIRPFDFYEIRQTGSLSKAYPFRDSVVVTLDYDTRSTNIITLNLSSGKQSSRKYLQQSLSSTASKAIRSNSFVSKDRLFQVKADKEELILSVNDLGKSEPIIQEYRMRRNEPLTFGGPEIFNWSETTMKNKVFFREIFRGSEYAPIANLSIAVNPVEDEFFCQVGGYGESEPTIGSEVLNGMTVGDGYTYTVNTYFNTILNQKTLAYSGTDANATTYGKVELYRKIMQDRIRLETMVRWKDRFIHGHYNTKLKSYFVDAYLGKSNE